SSSTPERAQRSSRLITRRESSPRSIRLSSSRISSGSSCSMAAMSARICCKDNLGVSEVASERVSSGIRKFSQCTEHLSCTHHHTTPAGDGVECLIMMCARVGGDGITDHKTLNIVLERLSQREQTANLGIHATNKQLVTFSGLHQRQQIAALKGAVAMFE